MGQKPAQMKRYAPPTADARGLLTAQWQASTIMATVQPLSGDELQRLDDGQRRRASRKAYTACCLRTVETLGPNGEHHQADRLVVGGDDFEVVSVEHQSTTLPHYKAILLRVDEAAQVVTASAHEILVMDAVRAWLKASAALADIQVIQAGQSKSHPARPYLTVRVRDLAHGGDAERVYEGGTGDQTTSIRQSETYAVEVNGYGPQTKDWLDTARAGLWQWATIATLEAAGVTLRPADEIQDLTAILDTHEGARFLLELEAAAIVSGLDSQPTTGLDTTTTTADLVPLSPFEVTTP